MENIVNKYLLAFDEINALTSTSFTFAVGDTAQIVDDILSILINAYRLGIQNISEMLEYDIEVDLEDMQEAIYQRIEGKTFEDRVAEYVKSNDMNGLQTLAETEFHRVYNTATYDGTEHIQANGVKVLKTWCTMLDDKVRDTHFYLEGVTISDNELFYTFDGDAALYPGGFGRAENNCGCRCILTYKRDN